MEIRPFQAASTVGNAISCDTKRLRRSEMPFHATRNGFDGRKCHFMRHQTASTVGNVISCDMTRPKRPLRVTRNEQKEVRGHFGSPETTKKWFSAISGHQKRPKRGFQPFRATRNKQKVVFGHYWSPEMSKKWFAAISGRQKRPKSGLRSFRATRRGFDGRPRHAARCARCV